jgi:hypothetical protein
MYTIAIFKRHFKIAIWKDVLTKIDISGRIKYEKVKRFGINR